MSAPQPKVDHTRIVRNRSSRGGVRPRLIVLHSTEGANRAGLSDLVGLGSWFDNPAAQASSTIGTDSEGHSARYVPDAEKPWTQSAFNSLSLSVEQVGFASQRSWPEEQLRATARWIAYWSEKYDIPIQVGAVSGRSVTRSGVVQHSQLGAAGGGHHDCGPGYPMAKVLELARSYAAGDAGASEGYDVLVKGEKRAVDELLRRRRVKYRNGGSWDDIAAMHQQRAEAAADWIRRRLKAIAKGDAQRRPARRAYLRKVIRDGKQTTR